MIKRKKIDQKIKLCFLIALVSALTLCISLNALNILEASLRQDLRQTTVGESEYILTQKNKELFETFPSKKGYKVAAAVDLEGKIEQSGKKRKIQITGMHYGDFKRIFGNTYHETGEVQYPEELKKGNILLSPKLASFLEVKNGDAVNLSLYGQTKEWKVQLAPKDNYYVKANENQVVMNKSDLAEWLDLDEKDASHNYIYQVQDDAQLEKGLGEKTNYLLQKSIDDQYIRTNMQTYFGIELVVLLFTFAIAFDVMSAAGLIFITERSKEIGTYLSTGFEKKDVFRMYRSMAFKIGLFGACIGVVMALLILQIFGYKSLSLSYLSLDNAIFYFIVSAIFSILATCFLSVQSFMKPLKKQVKDSTRSLLLSDNSVSVLQRKVKRIAALWPAAMVLLLVVLCVLGNEFSLVKTLLIVPLAIVTYKSLQTLFHFMTEKISSRTGKGMGLIALKNITTNFYLKKTLVLTTKIAIFMIIVGVLIFSIMEAMTGFYKDYHADAFIRLSPTQSFTNEEKERIRNIHGVKETLYYSSQSVTLKPDHETREVSALGVNSIDTYNDKFVNMKPVWKEGFSTEDFTTGHKVILSEILMEKYNLKLGDSIRIQSGNETVNFEIVGYARSLQNLGDLVYFNRDDKTFANGMPLNGVYLKGDLPKDLEKEIPNIIEDDFSYKDVSNMKENDMTNGMQVIIFFLAFGVLVAITSIAGIYGNYKLSYFTRRRELAVLSSNGFSKKQIKRMLRFEILINSCLSIGTAVLLFLVFKIPIEEAVKLVDLPIELQLTNEALLSLVLMIALISVFNMSLVGKSVNHSLNNRIRYLKER